MVSEREPGADVELAERPANQARRDFRLKTNARTVRHAPVRSCMPQQENGIIYILRTSDVLDVFDSRHEGYTRWLCASSVSVKSKVPLKV